MNVGAVKAPTIERSHTCKQLRQSVSTSPSRVFRCTALTPMAGGLPPSIEASQRPGVLTESAVVPRWYGGLCDIASMVARTAGAWAYGAADAAGLREALRQAAEERCHRRPKRSARRSPVASLNRRSIRCDAACVD